MPDWSYYHQWERSRAHKLPLHGTVNRPRSDRHQLWPRPDRFSTFNLDRIYRQNHLCLHHRIRR
jgi:hypothetical protein